MSIKFTDNQLIALSAAAARADRRLVMSEKLKGAAARKFTEKLLALRFAREIKAKTGMPIWRRDQATAQDYSLKLMAVGLKAIAVEDNDDEGSEATATATAGATVG